MAVEEGSDAAFKDMVEAFVEAIGNNLIGDDLKNLIDLAESEVLKVFPAKTLMPNLSTTFSISVSMYGSNTGIY